MKRYPFYIACCLCFGLSASLLSAQELPDKGSVFADSAFTYNEVPRYAADSVKGQHATLKMRYSSYRIDNPEAWQPKTFFREVYEIDLVFTKYPKNKEDWLTDYDWLLEKRIESVKEAVFELKTVKEQVRWNVILQTECENDDEARQLFHGAIVKYKPVLPSSMKRAITEIKTVLDGRKKLEDSVVLRVFDRNKWGNALVVSDWTGSMYRYGAQVILWHRLNYSRNGIRKFVFFNDGDMAPDREKPVGATGGIYPVTADTLQTIYNTMLEVMSNGTGGDTEENDLEAILEAMRAFPDFDEVILIADNTSGLRDMSLLPKLQTPLRIVLCGCNEGVAVHPHYLEIAHATGGSVHTVEEDIVDLSGKEEGEEFVIMGVRYRFEKGKFVKVGI